MAAALLPTRRRLDLGPLEGAGDLPCARTLEFTTLMLYQLFNVFNSRSDERSAFSGLFRNRWLWGALALSLGLHLLVAYVPFLQRAFDDQDAPQRQLEPPS